MLIVKAVFSALSIILPSLKDPFPLSQNFIQTPLSIRPPSALVTKVAKDCPFILLSKFACQFYLFYFGDSINVNQSLCLLDFDI